MSELSDAIESLVDSKIEKASRGGTQTVVATYQGRDGEGKPWVLLPGADSPTPVGRMAVEASAGDAVSVTIGDGMASVTANLTNPSAGVRRVEATEKMAAEAIDYASQASAAANSAQSSADSASAAAQRAQADAEAVNGLAAQAQSDAQAAQASAASASASAAQAIEDAEDAADAAQAAQDSLKSVVQGATTVEKAVSVMQTALEAVVDYDPANDTVQEWFWHDANGAHVLGDTSGYRNDIDSSGMNIKQVSTEASVARFGADESRIGESSKIAASIKSNGFSLRSDEGNGGKPFFSVTMPHSPVNPKTAWFKVLTSATQFPVEIPLTYTDDQLETHSIDSVYDMYGIFVSGSDSIPTITQDTVLEIDAPCDLIGNGGSLPDYVVSYDAANHKITVDNTGELAAILSEYAYAAIAGIIADGTAYEQPRMLFDVDNAGSLYADYHSLQLIDMEGGMYFHVSDLRGADGMLQVVDSFIGDGSNRRFQTTLGIDVVVSVKLNGMTTRQYTVVDGTAIYFDTAPGSNVTIEVTYKTTDSNAKAFTFGDRGQGNVGALSVVEGGNCIASGLVAHAEGIHTEASGWSAHAEGDSTVASGLASHAENYETTASGYASHAEGLGTTASGDNGAHAEGLDATASGDCSHAQNLGTKASSDNQTALGKYNVEDANDVYAAIIGNGTSDNARSDALAVRWNGLVDQAGETAYPTFIRSSWSTSSDESTLPVTPCFVLDTSDNALYWCSGNGIERLNPEYMPATAVAKSGANLNDQGDGEVWWGNNFTNAPGNGTGWIRVIKQSSVQTAYMFQGNTASPSVYVRTYVNSVWQPWVRLDDDDASATSGVFTAASGITVLSQIFHRHGKVAQLVLQIKHTSAWTVGTSYSVGTVSSGYRPVDIAAGTVGTHGIANLNADGSVYVRPLASVEISANSSSYVKFTYILA